MTTLSSALAGNAIYAPGPAGFIYADLDRSPSNETRAEAASGRERFRALRVIGLTLAAALIFVGSSMVAGFFEGFVKGLVEGAEIPIAPESLMLVFPLALYAVLAAASCWRPRSLRPDQWRIAAGWTWPRLDLRMIGSVFIIQVLCLIWVVATVALTPQLPASSGPGVGTLSMLVIFVLAAPIAEELFFRGWLHARAARLLPAWGVTVLTSVLFALAHYDGSLRKPLAVLALGVGTSWLRQRSGSLVPGTLLHILNNIVAVAALRLG